MQGGSAAMQSRELDAFNQVTLYGGKYNLILTQDSSEHGQQVTLSGGKNLLTGIQTQVSDSTLTIQDNNGCLLTNPADQVNIYISSSLLKNLTCYGGGNITSSNTLQASQFTVDCWMGSETVTLSVQASSVITLVRNENATITLTGTADSAYVYCGEAGSVDLSGLATRAVGIDHKSIRGIYVDAFQALHANIVYEGNVYYKNDPPLIQVLMTSGGRLIHIQ